MTISKWWPAGLLACALGGAALAQAPAAGEFRIGAVIAMSGPYSTFGQSMREGVELALERRGGKVLNRPVQVLWEDSETKPQIAAQKTSKLLAENVHLLFGAVASGETLAMMQLAERAKVPHLVTVSSSDDITAKNKTRYTFRTSDNITMANQTMMQWVRSAGIKVVYGVASDNAVTRDALDDGLKQMEALGIKVVGRDYPPLNASDYSVIVDKIARSGADAAFVYIGGNPGIAFVKQAGQVNLGAKVKIFGPVLMNETTAVAAGPGAVGVYSGTRYHFTIDNPNNKAFVEAFRKKYNKYPDENAGEAYDGMTWFLDVVERTGGFDREKWIDAFAESRFDKSIEGPKAMRACDHQAEQAATWGRIVQGAEPLPAYYLQLTNTVPARQLLAACKP